MRILLVAATLSEIRPFLDKLDGESNGSDHILNYRIKHIPVDILITGIGMIAAAFHLGKHLAGNRYDMAINAGIGGSYTKDLKIGEVVHITEECIPGLGAENGEEFLSLFDLELLDPGTPPFRNGRLVNENPLTTAGISKLKQVKGATSNTIHGNEKSIMKIRQLFDPQEESMEGAACFHAFLTEKVPFAEIRSISNYVDIRNKRCWNPDLAIRNLGESLNEIFTEICNH